MRWFGATGNGTTDDTTAVQAAFESSKFSNNGTLYFPLGKYLGAFVFDFLYDAPSETIIRNEINITGDGHGSVLLCNGTKEFQSVLLEKVECSGVQYA